MDTFIKFNGGRFKKQAGKDSNFQKLAKFQDYKSDTWNCFDFIIEFLDFIGQKLSKEEFIEKFVEAKLKTVSRYNALTTRIRENGCLTIKVQD